MTLRTLSSGPVVGLLVILSGCADKLGPVSGIVTLNGKPLPGATIVFHPIESGGGKGAPRQANGLTNAEGKFSLETVNDKGVAPGDYKVTFTKKVLPPDVKPADPKNMMEMMQVTQKMKESVPKEYTSMNTTPFTITIPRGGKDDADFPLKGEGEIDPDPKPEAGKAPAPESGKE